MSRKIYDVAGNVLSRSNYIHDAELNFDLIEADLQAQADELEWEQVMKRLNEHSRLLTDDEITYNGDLLTDLQDGDTYF